MIFDKTPEREIRGGQLRDLKNNRSLSLNEKGKHLTVAREIRFWNPTSSDKPENIEPKTE